VLLSYWVGRPCPGVVFEIGAELAFRLWGDQIEKKIKIGRAKTKKNNKIKIRGKI
jgi:hypothetical protein